MSEHASPREIFSAYVFLNPTPKDPLKTKRNERQIGFIVQGLGAGFKGFGV